MIYTDPLWYVILGAVLAGAVGGTAALGLWEALKWLFRSLLGPVGGHR